MRVFSQGFSKSFLDKKRQNEEHFRFNSLYFIFDFSLLATRITLSTKMQGLQNFLYTIAILVLLGGGIVIWQKGKPTPPESASPPSKVIPSKAAATSPKVAPTPKVQAPPKVSQKQVESPSNMFEEFSKSLVIIKGDKGAGSGFVLNYKGEGVVFTNTHVLSGNQTFDVLPLYGEKIALKNMEVARKYDLAKIHLREPRNGMPLHENISQEVSIGDEVVVMGNSDGAGVATLIRGYITGVGPELIEVDAKFVAGNSGSPVIHVKSKKVIGVATFSMITQVRRGHGVDSPFNHVERRFAYRLDNIPGWEEMNWLAFKKEAEFVEKLELRSQSLVNLANDIVETGQITFERHLDRKNPLYPLVKEHFERMRRLKSSRNYHALEKKRFVQGLLKEAEKTVEPRFYANFSDYHQSRLKEQARLSEELQSFFGTLDSLVK